MNRGRTSTLRFSEKAARRLQVLYSTPDIRAQRDAALRFLAVRPGETVIDVGCGPGFFSEMLADAVTGTGRVLAIDISRELLESARQRNHRAWLSYQLGDAMALDIPPQFADAVVSMQVLEYLSDIDQGIGETYRILKPSGRALIVATDWDGVVWHSIVPERMNRVLREWEQHCSDPRLPRTLAPRLRAAGFKLQQVVGHPIINLRLGEDTYSNGIMWLIADFLRNRRAMPQHEVESWKSELRSLSEEGRYFFGTMRYLYLVTKPGH